MKNPIRKQPKQQYLFRLLFCAAVMLLVGCDLGTYSTRASEGAKTFKPAKPPAVEEMDSETETEGAE